MLESIKITGNTLRTEFNNIIRVMIYSSEPDFYSSDTELLTLITEAITLSLDEVFKDSIRDNGLEKYNDATKKKEYVDGKILEIIGIISTKLVGVVKKMAKKENKEFLSYFESSVFASQIRTLFVSLFDKLITKAIERDVKKAELLEEIIGTFKGNEDISESSATIISDMILNQHKY
jgi:hypothetical protein